LDKTECLFRPFIRKGARIEDTVELGPNNPIWENSDWPDGTIYIDGVLECSEKAYRKHLRRALREFKKKS
jgi:hypothetical protein